LAYVCSLFFRIIKIAVAHLFFVWLQFSKDMPTLGAHFSDDEAPHVEAAAKAAGQKLAPYIADAVRTRMRSEGMLPGSQEAEALSEARDLIAAIGPVEFRRLILSPEKTPWRRVSPQPLRKRRRADRSE
jgi:hypothetical protein